MVLTLRQTLRKLEEASYSDRIKLVELEISKLPDLSFLSHVTSLNLSDNAFLFVPSQLAILKKLEYLNLSNNSIAEFSSDIISNLKSLKALLISGNRIVQLDNHSLPESLVELNLCNNRLVDFQEALALTSLRRLDVSNNQIRALPVYVTNMINLQELNLVCVCNLC